MSVKLFGREPTVWVGLVEAIIAVAVAIGLSWTNEQVALVMAVVVSLAGLYTAYVTHETLLGVVVGLTKAVLAVAIGFGAALSPELTGSLIALVTVVMGAFQRTQTSAMDVPSWSSPVDG